MIYAGLDLAAKDKNPSGLALLKNNGSKPKLIELKNVHSDEQIIEALKNVNNVAIDAPLIDGEIKAGFRPAEKQLIRWGLRLMSPSFLSELVIRAQKIISKLPLNTKIIEVHPRSSAIMLGLSAQRPLFNQPEIKKLLDCSNMACANKHQFDALISAYTAYLHHKKLTRTAGLNGSFIALPPSRNIKLVVFDMDGTLTRPTSSWEHIHKELGTWESAGLGYLSKFIAGGITYEEFATLDTSEWKGIPFEKIQAISQKVKYMPGIHELMAFLAAKKIKIAVISGGLSVIADKIAKDFGIKRIFVNSLGVKGGILTGEVGINVSYNGKLPIYKKLLKELKIKPYQVMTVGDTKGDLPLFQNSGLAFAINPMHEEIEDVADFKIKSLVEIVKILSL